MKVGIIGLPQTGKKTLFEILTEHRLSEKDLGSDKPLKGIAQVRDARFDALVALYKPGKEVKAKVDIELLPKLEKEAIASGEVFKDIADVDAVCHVVRAFRDDSVYHASGSVDPKRDIDGVNAELILHDLMFIEKRLERIEKDAKKTHDEKALKEKELLAKLKEHLDRELPLRILDLAADEKRTIASYPFITQKEMIVALNVAEDELKTSSLANAFVAAYAAQKILVMQVSAKIEAEIALLESEKDRADFMGEAGIAESAINLLTRLCIKALNLISFFTVGQDEVRQWTIRAGSSAPEAAGAIHTDLQKGFIRAEVMKYAELSRFGTEEKLKAAGKVFLKGKDYIVEDGDILNIRFNV